MEGMFPLNLPEGFFRTSEEIYQEVASYPIVPGEKLWQYWNVYTTTFRRLNDPTASRLESFWWHVMGSDRRFLSGKALAKIYEEISTGPSFVPLRGPSNQFHTPVLPRVTEPQPQVDNAGNGTTTQIEISQGPVDVPSRPTAERHSSKDAIASSSLRPPPPHPILKKSRGPSNSGPRPTARFVSPHESEDDAAREEDDTSSGSVAATGMRMRRPAKSPVKGEKKSTPTGRKFTASSAAKRHVRPPVVRRGSSQASVHSDTSAKAASPAAGGRTIAGSRSHSVEQPKSGSLAGSNNSTLIDSTGMSAKASGKRPVRAHQDKPRNTDSGSLSSAQEGAPPVIVQQQQQGPVVPQENGSGSTPTRSHEPEPSNNTVRAETPRSLLVPNSRSRATAPPMARSQSNIENQHHRPRELHLGRPLPQSMITPKSTPAEKVADVAVQVQFDSESVTAQGSGDGLDRYLPDSITIASRPSTSSLYTPTQPSPTPAPFLGRSKSQLTLLLEKMDQGKPKPHRDHS